MKCKNYINNEWVEAAEGDSFEVENPFTENDLENIQKKLMIMDTLIKKLMKKKKIPIMC